jgi:ribosomal protein L29
MTIYKINDNGTDRDMTEAESAEFKKTLSDTKKDLLALEVEKQARSASESRSISQTRTNCRRSSRFA